MTMSTLSEYIKEGRIKEALGLMRQNPSILDEVGDNGLTGFLHAAYSGNQQILDHAVACKQSFAWHEAIIAGKTEQVRQEMASDPSLVNLYAPDGFAPVALAAFFQRDTIARLLIAQGGDPNLSAKNPSKVNALHAAVAKCNYQLCELFLRSGADVNKAQNSGVTPLHSAAKQGDIPLVQLLLTHGADASLAMSSGDTALTLARAEGHTELLSLLSG